MMVYMVENPILHRECWRGKEGRMGVSALNLGKSAGLFKRGRGLLACLKEVWLAVNHDHTHRILDGWERRESQEDRVAREPREGVQGGGRGEGGGGRRVYKNLKEKYAGIFNELTDSESDFSHDIL